MSKVYAVIQPAFTYNGGSSDIMAPFVSLFHMVQYESVCGYSLGQRVHFFDTLEAAQDYIAPRSGSKPHAINPRLQDAVIELNVNGDSIEFRNIYVVEEMKKVLRKLDHLSDFYEKVEVPIWKEKDILSSDVSEKASHVLMREMKNNHYQVKVEAAPKSREPRSHAVISGGMGSSACTLFTNGARVTASNGKVTYTDPDGKKTIQEGSGYVASRAYREDGGYDVDLKVVNRK